MLVLADEPPSPYVEGRRFAWAVGLCLPAFVGLLWRWVSLVSSGDHYPMYSARRVPWYLTLVLILATWGSVAAHGAALPSFYVSAYMFTQTFVVALKYVTRRMRPGIVLDLRLKRVRRHLPCLNYRGKRGATVLESFPSGDVAGAAVLSTSLYLATDSYASFLFTVGSAFGRMYFWAHHLGDVLVGAAIAVVCTVAIHRFVVSWQDFTGFHACAFCVPAHVLIRQLIPSWLRKPVPERYRDVSPTVKRSAGRQVW